MIGLRFAVVFLLALATLSRGSLAEDVIKQADVDSLVLKQAFRDLILSDRGLHFSAQL